MQGILQVFLVKDPESRYSNDGKLITKIQVPISSKEKNAKTIWINYTAFGEIAEHLINAGIQKGSLITVVGRFQTNAWGDPIKVDLNFYIEKVLDIQVEVSKDDFKDAVSYSSMNVRILHGLLTDSENPQDPATDTSEKKSKQIKTKPSQEDLASTNRDDIPF